MAERPVAFAGLLRQLRTGAGLTQEELAEAAGVGVRSIRYLERGRVASPQKETVRLLADALGLIGPVRAEFEAAARGRAGPGGVAAATRTLPRDIASFTGRQQELEQLAKAAADDSSLAVPITPAVIASEQQVSNAFTASGLIPGHVNFANFVDTAFNATAGTAA